MRTIKPLIIFDFDNTIFRTREFWRSHLFPSYESIGINRTILETAFIAGTTKKVDYFIPDYFIDELFELTKDANFDRNTLLEIFKKQVYSPTVKKFYYPYALKLMAKVKNAQNEMILISYGDKKFKETFFKHCGIYEFFSPENVYIINKPKVKTLESFFNYSTIIVINDVLEETEQMLKKLNKAGTRAHAFLLDYKNIYKPENIKNNAITVCSSLKEVKIQ